MMVQFISPGEAKIIRASLADVAAIGGIGVPLLLVLRLIAPISHIPSGSMEPVLKEGDRVLVNNMQYFTKDPERGDIVAFDSGFRGGLWNKEKVRFVKRVVGLPGDEVQILNGDVYINGQILSEPYTVGHDENLALVKVPFGHYFLMGDNREHSYDSRYLGPVPAERIQGKVAFIARPSVFRLGF
jgi:signal peptidase I